MATKSKLFQAAHTAETSVVTTPAQIQQLALQRTKAKRSYTNNQTPNTETANGAPTFTSAGSKVLDLFAKGASMRSATVTAIRAIVKEAFKEEPALAGACLFYIRDVLQGQGERRFFRIALHVIASDYPESMTKLIPLIPQYGRWDDLFALKDTGFYHEALVYYADQLHKDCISAESSISLAAKWAPSEKAGTESKEKWKDFVKHFDSPKAYRQLVATLRKRLKIVETKMSEGKWDEIQYDQVPSRAALIYRKAFKKYDADRYSAFITELLDTPKEQRVKNIKSTTLYPYDIVSKVRRGDRDRTLDALWEAMPDYLQGKQNNSLAVVDTSGSMEEAPNSKSSVQMIDVAISLGLYLADKAKGPWANQFITFSENPTFQTVEGTNLYDKVHNMADADWHMSTNLEKVFSSILSIAVKSELHQDDLPQTIYIISDMQFNSACFGSYSCSRSKPTSTFQNISQMFANAGYVRPNIVFWNVSGEAKDVPVTYNEYGVGLLSGFSATSFRLAMGDNTTPEEMMRSTLEGERYEKVRLAFV